LRDWKLRWVVDREALSPAYRRVALAAIQGLYELVQELQAENEQMRDVMERAGLR